MFTLVGAACIGIALAGVYTLLLVAITTGSSFFNKIPHALCIVGGLALRMSVIALVVVCMLRLSINHIILMMIAFYATEVVIMIAYKGVD